MRRFLPLIAIGALLMGGCAISDMDGTLVDQNQSHGVLSCDTVDRIANTQQTVEASARVNLREACCGAGCTPPLPSSFVCLDLGPLSNQDARDYTRFLGDWMDSGYGSAATYGCPTYDDPGCGHWAIAGIKRMPNGDKRFTSWWRPMGQPITWDGIWECGWRTDGGKWTYGTAYGEGQIAGDIFNPNMVNAQDWQIEAILVDSAPGQQWGGNVVAATPGRINYGFTVYTGFYYPFFMGKMAETPIKGGAGLAEFFSGESLTVNRLGYDVTGSAELLDNGKLALRLERVEHEGSVFVPSTPIEIVTSRTLGRGPWEFNWDGQRESVVELATWALDNVPMNETIDLEQFIPELGIEVGKGVAISFDRSSIENYIAKLSSEIQPRERDRLR
jgi:hypothetical protein